MHLIRGNCNIVKEMAYAFFGPLFACFSGSVIGIGIVHHFLLLWMDIYCVVLDRFGQSLALL